MISSEAGLHWDDQFNDEKGGHIFVSMKINFNKIFFLWHVVWNPSHLFISDRNCNLIPICFFPRLINPCTHHFMDDKNLRWSSFLGWDSMWKGPWPSLSFIHKLLTHRLTVQLSTKFTHVISKRNFSGDARGALGDRLNGKEVGKWFLSKFKNLFSLRKCGFWKR